MRRLRLGEKVRIAGQQVIERPLAILVIGKIDLMQVETAAPGDAGEFAAYPVEVGDVLQRRVGEDDVKFFAS